MKSKFLLSHVVIPVAVVGGFLSYFAVNYHKYNVDPPKVVEKIEAFVNEIDTLSRDSLTTIDWETITKKFNKKMEWASEYVQILVDSFPDYKTRLDSAVAKFERLVDKEI